MKKVKHKFKTGEFAKNLVNARRAVGFRTAYQFYHDNEGRRTFSLSFSQYLRIESGSALPGPAALGRIVLALRLLVTQAELRALLLAYIRDTLGGGRPADYILSPLLETLAEPEPKPAAPGTGRLRKAEPMSCEAFAAMTQDEAAFWCAHALMCGKGPRTAAELSQKLSLAPDRVRKALSALVRNGLAVRKDGKYSRSGEKCFAPPAGRPGMEKYFDSARRYLEEKDGKEVFARNIMVRSDDVSIQNFAGSVSRFLSKSGLDCAGADAGDNGVFCVTAKIKKMKDF